MSPVLVRCPLIITRTMYTQGKNVYIELGEGGMCRIMGGGVREMSPVYDTDHHQSYLYPG